MSSSCKAGENHTWVEEYQAPHVCNWKSFAKNELHKPWKEWISLNMAILVYVHSYRWYSQCLLYSEERWETHMCKIDHDSQSTSHCAAANASTLSCTQTSDPHIICHNRNSIMIVIPAPVCMCGMDNFTFTMSEAGLLEHWPHKLGIQPAAKHPSPKTKLTRAN
jgi:hypothetical protein